MRIKWVALETEKEKGSFESVQSRAEVYMLKACDTCADNDMGQL